MGLKEKLRQRKSAREKQEKESARRMSEWHAASSKQLEQIRSDLKKDYLSTELLNVTPALDTPMARHLILSELGAKTITLIPSVDCDEPYIYIETDQEGGPYYILHWDGSAWSISEGYIEPKRVTIPQMKPLTGTNKPYSLAVFEEALENLLG